MRQRPETPVAPRLIPEWRQPDAPEMGRIEAPSTQPYQPPGAMETIPEFIQPEGMETEETLIPRVKRQPPAKDRG